jgi:hypothetical protein
MISFVLIAIWYLIASVNSIAGFFLLFSSNASSLEQNRGMLFVLLAFACILVAKTIEINEKLNRIEKNAINNRKSLNEEIDRIFIAKK